MIASLILLQSPGLLLASPTHLIDERLDLRRVAGDGAGRFAHPVYLRLATVRLRNRLLYKRSRVLSGLGGTLCQVPYLVRNHGETHAGFSRARRFHCRVQRQDIGLKCDRIDDLDDSGNLLTGTVDFAHGHNHLVQRPVGLAELFHGVSYDPHRAPGAFRVPPGHRVDLLGGGRGFFKGGGIRRGTLSSRRQPARQPRPPRERRSPRIPQRFSVF